MTVQETSMVMNVLNAAYPGFYAKSSDAERKQILGLWAEMFREDDVALVAAAVKALIVAEASGFPPTIGQVKARLRQITTPQEMTEGEAWALVAAAIRNSAYDSRREFERLPEAVLLNIVLQAIHVADSIDLVIVRVRDDIPARNHDHLHLLPRRGDRLALGVHQAV